MLKVKSRERGRLRKRGWGGSWRERKLWRCRERERDKETERVREGGAEIFRKRDGLIVSRNLARIFTHLSEISTTD